jgi:hypothetical protein
MVEMEAENLEERLAEALDGVDAWASWWQVHGARGYTGAVRPPLWRTERLLDHRRGIVASTYRREAVRRRRERGPRQPALPFLME